MLLFFSVEIAEDNKKSQQINIKQRRDAIVSIGEKKADGNAG
jgi:hypothetical protein